MKSFLFVFVLLFSGRGFADTLFEFGAISLTESTATPTSTSSGKTFYNVAFLFSLNKHVWGGWNFAGLSHAETTTGTSTIASTDSGPYLKWQFGKANLYSLSAAYHLSSKATYSSGATNENWDGTSLWLQFGITPEVSAGFNIGASLNYYAASYSKKVASSIESSAANSKTWVFPMLTLTKQW